MHKYIGRERVRVGATDHQRQPKVKGRCFPPTSITLVLRVQLHLVTQPMISLKSFSPFFRFIFSLLKRLRGYIDLGRADEKGTADEGLYSDLPLRTKTSIRLLCLCQENTETGQSDCEDSLIQLNLQVVDLEQNPPPFQALSYTWGSPFLDDELAREYDSESHPRYISLNGRKVEVRRNLFEFIQRWDSSPESIHDNHFEASLPVKHLEDSDDSFSHTKGLETKPVTYLWVDALCINQDDLIERKEQVMLMSRIYTKATMVLVWLGIEDESVEHAVEFVNDLQTESYGEAMNHSDRVQAAADWWRNRTWFTRAWVIQEVALAQHIRLLCGSEDMDYWQFFKSLNSTSLDGTHVAGVPLFLAKGDGTGNYQPLHLIDIRIRISPDSRERKMVRQNIAQPVATWEHKPSLSVLLSKSWAFQATDPRDKIYSLLGISRDDFRHRIEPDYEVDAASLIVRVGRIFMEGSPDEPIQRWTSGTCEVLEPLEGLSFVEAGYLNELELPSWIASFGVDRTYYRLWMLDFNAGRVELGRTMDLIIPSDNPRALHLRGIYRDRIIMTMQIPGRFPTEQIETMPLALLRFMNYLPLIYHPTGQSRAEALRRTLLVDQTDDLLPTDTIESEHLSKQRLHCESALEDDAEADQLQAMPEFQEFVYGTGSGPTPLDLGIMDKYHAKGRSIFETENGYIGLGSWCAECGDEVWLIAGARTPYILRALPEEDVSGEVPERVLIEEAYVHGTMHGEEMDEEELEEVILV
ncbi:HET-domain-containing protein [Aspergillus sclerotioniger CBS 115572]|uniref:HET-domain-containing protein n=1 Tax=Aspergillus sclerotioniger CBS 115572 TaxID=1450535 RepID=A0A317VFW2_9EURO|nr:HET-domain-containing protein [Aspergillus sclerotioniger CBS 115572]PWY71802.1 HET-domain-containing protein [Aspergillus sclerotioniger CBS 115572]